MDQRDWTNDICVAMDSKDYEKFVSYFADDGLFRIANAAPVKGHNAIIKHDKAFFAMLTSLITTLWSLMTASLARVRLTTFKPIPTLAPSPSAMWFILRKERSLSTSCMLIIILCLRCLMAVIERRRDLLLFLFYHI